jgi:hypothetical protein
MSVRGVGGPDNLTPIPKVQETQKKGLFSRISSLFKPAEPAPIYLTRSPTASSEPLNPEEKKKVERVVSQVLLMKVLNQKGFTDPESLSVQTAKAIMQDPRVAAYLQTGQDLDVMKMLMKIAFRAHQQDWQTPNLETEAEELKKQCWGKKEFYRGDMHRAVKFVLNGVEVPRDPRVEGQLTTSNGRFEQFKQFCHGDEAYAKQLSNVVHQGLSTSLAEKIENVVIPLGISSGMTEKYSGGVQDIAITRRGSELLIKMTVAYPLSSMNLSADGKPHDIMQLLATITVVVDEEAFKMGDMSSARFVHLIEPYEAPQKSSS